MSTVATVQMTDRRLRGGHSGRGASAQVMVGSALAWAVAIGLRVVTVPERFWRWRDDAVITLSHARNMVDFGTIGVSPGGSRVEGFSSPLQFFLSSVYFRLTHGGYEGFLDLQVVVCVLLCGALSGLAALRVLRRRVPDGLPVIRRAIAVSSAIAVVTAASWTAVGWMLSGMENPLAVVLGFGLLAVVAGEFKSASSLVAAGSLVGLLGVVRVEFAALCLPLLVAVTSAGFVRRERALGRTVLLVNAPPLAMWLALHLWRHLYFGSFLPNTAYVQSKAFSLVRVAAFFATAVVFVVIVRLLREQRIFRLRARYCWWVVMALSLVAWLGEQVAVESPQRFPMLFALVAVIAAASAQHGAAPGDDLQIVCAALVLLPLGQLLVMGPARLEVWRIASIAAPWAGFWVGLLLLLRVRSTGSEQGAQRRAFAVGVSLVLAASILMDNPRDLPWDISPNANRVLAAANAFRSERLEGIATPIVANADLGKLSFAKQVMVVDLGLIGDPLLARIRHEAPASTTEYLTAVAAPDVVEAHGVWSCSYTEWLTSPAFVEGWTVAVRDTAETVGPDRAGCAMEGDFTIWTRRGSEAEYALTRELASASNPEAPIEAAIEGCRGAGTDPFRCEFVRRAITRNAERLRRSDMLTVAADALAMSPTADLDRLILLQPSGWPERAFGAFMAVAES